MQFCTKCQENLPDDARFCEQCGATVEVKLVCKQCQSQLREGAKFCDHCGATVEQKLVCKQCQSELREGAKFCDACGWDVRNVVGVATPQAQNPIICRPVGYDAFAAATPVEYTPTTAPTTAKKGHIPFLVAGILALLGVCGIVLLSGEQDEGTESIETTSPQEVVLAPKDDTVVEKAEKAEKVEEVEDSFDKLASLVGMKYYGIQGYQGVELEISEIGSSYYASLDFGEFFPPSLNNDPLLPISMSDETFYIPYDQGSMELTVNAVGKIYATFTTDGSTWVNHLELLPLNQWLEGKYEFYDFMNSTESPISTELYYSKYLTRRWFANHSSDIRYYDTNPVYIVTCNVEDYRGFWVDFKFYTSDMTLHTANGDLMDLDFGTNLLTIDGQSYYS